MKCHNYTIKSLKPKVVNDLIRVGNIETDGGYLLSRRQLALTKVLIGLGINYDWTFEKHFKSLQPDAKIYCYDFSVGPSIFLKGSFLAVVDIFSPSTYFDILNRKKKTTTVFRRPFMELQTYFSFNDFFNAKKNNFFYQKGISDERSEQFITASEMFNDVDHFDKLPDNSVFIKIDIEGSEYDILEEVISHSSKINGMVMEFHNTKQLWYEFKYLIDKILVDFEVIHIHGNNCCGYIPDTSIPNFIELSFIKRELLTASELSQSNNLTYPLASLDKPCIKRKKDLTLGFE